MWPLILLYFLESFWLLFSITVLLISFWLFQLLFLPRLLMTPRLLFPVVSFCFLPYSNHISLSPIVLGNTLYTSHSFQERSFSLRFLSDLPIILPVSLLDLHLSWPLNFEQLQGWASSLSILDLLVISSYFLTLNSIYLMMKTKLHVLLYKRSIYFFSFVILLQG